VADLNPRPGVLSEATGADSLTRAEA